MSVCTLLLAVLLYVLVYYFLHPLILPLNASTDLVVLTSTSLPLGMVKYAQQGGITGRTMVAVTSGANMDFDRCVCVWCSADVAVLACVRHPADESFQLPGTNLISRFSCVRRLRFVSERADSSETLMAISIPERAGAIREFYKVSSTASCSFLTCVPGTCCGADDCYH
jgi:hypothetical protein